MTVTKIFASIEYIVVLLDSMGDYRLSLGFHTKVGGSGKRQRKKKPESVLTERTNPENPSYVVTGVSRKHDYEIQVRSKPGRVVVRMETYPETEVKPWLCFSIASGAPAV